MLSSIGFTIIGLNIAPHYPCAPGSIHALCRSGFVPLRFLQLALFSFWFFLTGTPHHCTTILWLYNTRAAESLVAIMGLLLRPRLRLVLQLEDLPSARAENHGLAGHVDAITTSFLARRAYKIFAVSPNVAAAFQNLNPRIRTSITLLPPALDPLLEQKLRHRPRPFSGNIIQILYAGAYQPDKGVMDLIEAFNRLPSDRFRLLLVGSAPQPLIQEWKDHPSIVFRGVVSNSTLFDLYVAADVVVNPHRPILHAEHVFPFKLVEIVASGALPLTTSVPGSHSFALPSDCFFQGVDQLASKLMEAPRIWASHRIHLLQAASACRFRYSQETIQQQLHRALAQP